MFRKSIALLVLSAVSMNLVACGRLINGTKQNVGISSTPEGATVTIEPGGITAVTPATVELKRRGSYTALVTKEGYEPASAKISRHISAWTFGNFMIPSVFVAVTGFITDRATGGGFKLTPKKVDVTLVESAKTLASPVASASTP